MSELQGNLEDLVKHPGWRWFTEAVLQEWGAGGIRFEATINKFADSREDDAHVMNQIRQIAVARREILRVLKLPEEKIAAMREPTKTADIRAALDPALAGMGRRGSL